MFVTWFSLAGAAFSYQLLAVFFFVFHLGSQACCCCFEHFLLKACGGVKQGTTSAWL